MRIRNRQPELKCPRCGRWHVCPEGMLSYCPCGWCAHAHSEKGFCVLCGTRTAPDTSGKWVVYRPRSSRRKPFCVGTYDMCRAAIDREMPCGVERALDAYQWVLERVTESAMASDGKKKGV